MTLTETPDARTWQGTAENRILILLSRTDYFDLCCSLLPSYFIISRFIRKKVDISVVIRNNRNRIQSNAIRSNFCIQKIYLDKA